MAAATLLSDRVRASLAQEAERARADRSGRGSLRWTLELLLATVEAQFEGEMLASILLLDDDGERLWHGAAPSLPQDYCAAIDGLRIGPGVGSCGTAAYLGHPVYVTDITTDPLWVNFRELAAAHGLRACWSTPVQGADGRLLGTFAIYYRTPRSPTMDELEAIKHVISSASEAILAGPTPLRS